MTEEKVKKTLTLKKPLQQTPVRGVQVEVRKKRILPKDTADEKTPAAAITEEQAARLKLLAEAQKYEEEQEKERKVKEQEKKRREEEEKEKRKKEEKEEQKTADNPPEKQPSEEAAAPKFIDAGKEDVRKKTAKETAEEEFSKRRRVIDVGEKRIGKVNVRDVNLSEDGGDGLRERSRSLSSIKRAREKERLKMQAKLQEKVIREVVIPEAITVQELSNRMTEKASDVIKALMKMGMMVTITETIDADTAQLVVEELGHKFRRVAEADVEEGLKIENEDKSLLRPRPPVVTVMGHVDHGKTSLLDALRKTRVAEGEHGGITQHIGAYQVTVRGDQKVTFIDTPGHAAFTEMRARGAQVTDIVILIVAANDGVMPQTIEAITHAKAANVPIIVAINKIDVPGADPNRVRMELLNHEVVVESMGGETQCVEISAKQRQNLDKLLEAVLLQAEMLNLKANPDRPAEGTIIEAKMEKGKGPVATVLVQKGTLRVGDIAIAGKQWGRVRALIDEFGSRKEKALPSEPIEILGLESIPEAGDDFLIVESENKAREVSSYRTRKEREARHVKSAKSMSVDNIFSRISSGETKELPVIIKVDVQGSLEALAGSLKKISTDKAQVKVISASVGGINESDITLAKASNAFIIGFNVRANAKAREISKRDGIEIRYYSVIYDAIDDVKKALEGMLSPIMKENITGYAEIQRVFNITGVGKVAGCIVRDGVIRRSGKLRLVRDNVVVYEGDIGQMKHLKDDVKEAKYGTECGISFAGFNDIQVGDMIEGFEIEKIAATL